MDNLFFADCVMLVVFFPRRELSVAQIKGVMLGSTENIFSILRCRT